MPKTAMHVDGDPLDGKDEIRGTWEMFGVAAPAGDLRLAERLYDPDFSVGVAPALDP